MEHFRKNWSMVAHRIYEFINFARKSLPQLVRFTRYVSTTLLCLQVIDKIQYNYMYIIYVNFLYIYIFIYCIVNNSYRSKGFFSTKTKFMYYIYFILSLCTQIDYFTCIILPMYKKMIF